MGVIKILLADDHAIVRDGLKLLLQHEPDMSVVGEAQDGQEAVDQAARLSPDVVILDLSMPRLGGLSALPLLRSAVPKAHILVLTMHDNEQFLFEALNAGASGYLLKKSAADELMDAVHTVMSGKVYLSPLMSQRMVGDYMHRLQDGTRDAAAVDALTRREQEVLRLIAEGHTNQQIADLLHLSIKTVQTHRGHILEKLDLHDRTELVKYAISKGYISLDVPPAT